MARPQLGALPGTPTTIDFGDSADAGSSGSNAALDDHTHGMANIADGDVPATHSGSAHHTKYLNSEAISAVEGEATLLLSGAVDVDGTLTVNTIDDSGAGQVNVTPLLSANGGFHSGGASTFNGAISPLTHGTRDIGVTNPAWRDLFLTGDIVVGGTVDGVDIAARDHAESHAGSTHTGVPGGELGGSWGTPTVDATHSGSAHTNIPTQTGDLDMGSFDILDADIINLEGAKFPATQVASADANTLDDYEIGTWTPEVTFSTVGDLSVVHSTQEGRYIKMGDLVTVFFEVTTSTWTFVTSAGNFRITGLPFNSKNTTANIQYGSVVHSGWTSGPLSAMALACVNNSDEMNVEFSDDGGGIGILSKFNYATGTNVSARGSITYEVA